jgi:FkbH-like protein
MTAVYVVSDFNAELVARYLSADKTPPLCQATSAPYGQLGQVLASAPPVGSEGVALVWTRPEGAILEYARLLQGEAIDSARLNAEVDAYTESLKAYASKLALLLVAAWIPSRKGRGLGVLDWKVDGHAHWLARMNVRLAEALSGVPSAYMLDAARWLAFAGAAPRDSRFWYAMKSPFTEGVCQAAARDVKAAVRAARGQARKLVVVDLDDTLWGGIVGEQGWQNLRLGGHDHVGEAHADFQAALRALTRRGIQVALVSKNDEATALEAVDRHPNMALRRSDLAGWRINWKDKAENIVDLTRALNLGLQSVVFIDDSPIERGRVREALPDVLVPEWPPDPTRFADALAELDCFDQAAITDEDRARTRMYVEERDRTNDSAAFSSLAHWLSSLDIRARVAPLAAANAKRTVQLLNKTNQLNLATRRRGEAETTAWLAGGDARQLMTVSVADRFGDLGLTGVVSWERRGEDLALVDYLLSCRAMGRKVEETMVHLAVEAARAGGATRVVARAVPSERNGPCLEFWRGSGFAEIEPLLFVWDASQPYPLPECIHLERTGP